MQVLVGRDDRRGDFGSREQLPIVGRDEIGANLRGDLLRTVRLDLRQSDEVDLRVSRGDFSADQSDPAAADDGQPDTLGVFLRHQATARTFFASDSGSATGSLLSADKSAAM